MSSTSPEPQIALGRAIRARREELRPTQLDLALELGADATWISHLESGRQNPAYGTVDRIARALNLTIGEPATRAGALETSDRQPLNQPLRKASSP
jgi:transcriptional regulator with XRE-family HTH domain